MEGVIIYGNLLKEVNNTFLTLIPKKEKDENFDDFRPISLCNALYKILTKTLANRIQKLLPKLISEEKTSFFKEDTSMIE